MTTSNRATNIETVSKSLGIATVICSLLVVINHITCFSYPQSRFPQHITSDFFATVTDIIRSFSMPTFFAISGAVFYLTKKEWGKYSTFGILVSNKFKRLIVPYIFAVSVIQIPIFFILNISADSNYVSALLRNVLLIGDLAWLWYLPTLFCIFLIVNNIYIYILKKKLTWIVLFAMLSISAIVLQLNFSLHQFSIPFRIMRYLLFFYIGYIAVDKAGNINLNVSLKALVTAIITFAVLSFFKEFVLLDIPYIPLVFNIIVAISGIGLVFAISLYLYHNSGIIKSPVFQILKRYSFGVYLFHSVVIFAFFSWFGKFIISPYLSFIIVFPAAMLGALAISAICYKIPYIRTAVGFREPKRNRD